MSRKSSHRYKDSKRTEVVLDTDYGYGLCCLWGHFCLRTKEINKINLASCYWFYRKDLGVDLSELSKKLVSIK